VRVLRRLCGAGRLFVRLAAVTSLLAFAQARGDEPPEAPNPVTIVVFGDSQAAGLARGLQRVLVEDSRYRVLNRTHAGAALVHRESEWLAPVANFTSREKADIAVVMLGANDRLDMRDEHGASLHFREEDWRNAYAARTDKILTLLAGAGLRVIWCGNPIARSAAYSEDMIYINDIDAEEAAHFGAQFISLWTAVADDQGRYAAYGKDREGTTTRMRADDGIHFTAAGYELIAEKIVGLLSTSAANGR
jgi:uncharacterized protein